MLANRPRWPCSRSRPSAACTLTSRSCSMLPMFDTGTRSQRPVDLGATMQPNAERGNAAHGWCRRVTASSSIRSARYPEIFDSRRRHALPIPRSGRGNQVTVRFIIPILLLLTGPALAADPPVTPAQAMALLQSASATRSGRPSRPSSPATNTTPAMRCWPSGRWTWRTANGAMPSRCRAADEVAAGVLCRWELMIQVDQASGDLDDRDASIEALYTAWKSALDPAIATRTASCATGSSAPNTR